MQSLAPGPNAIDVTPSRDGGVLKEILRAGKGGCNPVPEDRVCVQYEAMFIDGRCVDSSRFHGENGFEFILGKGAVVRAWEFGIATMFPGEKARFYCRDSYTSASSAEIAVTEQNTSNFTTVYDIQLLWCQGKDITKRKDKGVLRSILKRSEEPEVPNDGSTCEVHIKGIHDGRVFEDREVKFVLGNGSEAGIVPGVELGVKICRRGERLRLCVKANYAYRDVGCAIYNIPPGADLMYEVEMKNFVRVKDHWEMDTAELISTAQKAKEKGTELFELGNYEGALNRYQKVVRYLSSETSAAGDNSERVKSLLLAAYLNIALCHLKLNEDLEARDAADSALELDPGNVKARYRRGLANLSLQSLDEACNDFRRILEIDSGNKLAHQQLNRALTQLSEDKARQKTIFGGMFDKFARLDKQREAGDGRNQTDVFSDIGDWSNDLASGMMTLEQEMAAFGEKMPEPRYKHNNKENENPMLSDDDD